MDQESYGALPSKYNNHPVSTPASSAKPSDKVTCFEMNILMKYCSITRGIHTGLLLISMSPAGIVTWRGC